MLLKPCNNYLHCICKRNDHDFHYYSPPLILKAGNKKSQYKHGIFWHVTSFCLLPPGSMKTVYESVRAPDAVMP